MTRIELPDDAVVVFVGSIGTGKSTFARKHFQKHDIVETDFIREQLTGDFENQDYNSSVFEILYATIDARLKAGILTVVDSTGSTGLIENIKHISKKYNRPSYIIKFPHLSEEQLVESRMKHRMKYIHVYHKMVERIDNTVYPQSYNVIELTDINDAEVVIKKHYDDYRLSHNHDYVIIPDLHGEIDALLANVIRYDDEMKYICLGDVVDRGVSSYKTFCLVFKLFKEERLFPVIGNHDNKLSRFFRKWLSDESFSKFKVPNSYGMTISFGLEKTINEFYELPEEKMLWYAKSFIEYYEAAYPYLFIETDEEINFFSHAGLPKNAALRRKLNRSDISAVLYNTISDISEVEELFKNVDKDITVHVGHEFIKNTISVFLNEKNTRRLIKHDIGLGKKHQDNVPKFKVIRNGSSKSVYDR